MAVAGPFVRTDTQEPTRQVAVVAEYLEAFGPATPSKITKQDLRSAAPAFRHHEAVLSTATANVV